MACALFACQHPHTRIIYDYAVEYRHRAIGIAEPEDTFGSSNINSYALIIKNSLPKKKTTSYSSVILENEQFSFVNKHTVPQKI